MQTHIHAQRAEWQPQILFEQKCANCVFIVTCKHTVEQSCKHWLIWHWTTCHQGCKAEMTFITCLRTLSKGLSRSLSWHARLLPFPSLLSFLLSFHPLLIFRSFTFLSPFVWSLSHPPTLTAKSRFFSLSPTSLSCLHFLSPFSFFYPIIPHL